MTTCTSSRLRPALPDHGRGPSAELDARKAEAFYRQALELCPPRHPTGPRLLEKTAEPPSSAAGCPRPSATSRSDRRVPRSGETLGAGEAMVRLARTYWFRGETDRKRALLAQAIELLEREPPGRELALAYTHTAADHMVANRSQECAVWSEKALTLAQELGLDAEAIRASAPGLARCQLGDVVGGLADLREALRLSLDLGLGNETIRSYGNLGDWVWVAEGPAGAWTSSGGDRVRGAARRTSGHVGQGRDALASVRPRALGRAASRVAGDVIEWDRRQGGARWPSSRSPTRRTCSCPAARSSQAQALAEVPAPRPGDPGPAGLVPAVAVVSLIEHARGNQSTAVRLIEEIERSPGIGRSSGPPPARGAPRVCGGGRAPPGRRACWPPADRALATGSVLTGRAVLTEARGSLRRRPHSMPRRRSGGRTTAALERGQAALGAGAASPALGRHVRRSPDGRDPHGRSRCALLAEANRAARADPVGSP